MSRTALFISPHLDDVAFSCAGTMIAHVRAGWRTVLVTCFTATVAAPRGFALACQTDKGIPASTDYMALRRAEDRRFADRAGVAEVVHLEHAEAPHRGYEEAAALFARTDPDDDVWRALARDLAGLRPAAAARVFVPQGLGGHVDHEQVRRAVSVAGLAATHAYRDTPYAIRAPGDGDDAASDITADLAAKLDGCAAYASQLGFQFGGETAMRRTLTAFASAEAHRCGRSGAAERFAEGAAAGGR